MTLAALGGPRFLLLLFSYVTQGVLVILCGAALLIYARPQPARSG